jgi:P27 family predicted phage terminase small subunit
MSAPKPTALLRITGNYKKTRHAPKTKATLAGLPLLDPPEWLGEKERQHWQRALDAAPRGLLERIDATLLAAWCVQCELHRQTTIALAGEPLTITTPTGVTKPHPLLAVQAEAARLILRLGDTLGFSPLGRTKMRIDAPTDNGGWDRI